MSDLVGNPEDRFSRVEAHIFHGHVFLVRRHKLCLVQSNRTVGA